MRVIKFGNLGRIQYLAVAMRKLCSFAQLTELAYLPVCKLRYCPISALVELSCLSLGSVELCNSGTTRVARTLPSSTPTDRKSRYPKSRPA